MANANIREDRWDLLMNARRRKGSDGGTVNPDIDGETRTEIERDYDRILFSTPIRRLADKTQVFPLDKNDSVRTRLTHSHEVSNLARSIGTTLVFKHSVAKDVHDISRNLPALLATIGLVHDLGNPPFGHQGESAIPSWFLDHQQELFNEQELNQQQKLDFLRFEGNAQGFRLVTRLQLLNDNYGLNLTYATLASMLKYTVGSNGIDKNIAAKKKHGFFFSEENIVKEVLGETGIKTGERHPLTYVMEACDDIAYVVLDVEDAVKKGLASFSDLMGYLEHHGNDDGLIKTVVEKSQDKHNVHLTNNSLSPYELNDVSMQRFRVFAIGAMVRAAVSAFIEKQEDIINGKLDVPLLKISKGEKLCASLKDFGYKHAYTHRSVLKVELVGYNVIRKLMDIFWDAIVNRKDYNDVTSARVHPFSRYVYGRISENYRRVFEHPIHGENNLPIRYRECLLLTDMISGMTDSFALDLKSEFDSLICDYKPIRSISKLL